MTGICECVNCATCPAKCQMPQKLQRMGPGSRVDIFRRGERTRVPPPDAQGDSQPALPELEEYRC